MTASVMEESIRSTFTFKTEWWETADGAYKTDKEKFIFLKTIMDYGSMGIIPKGCESKDKLKTDEDRIRWSALRLCIDFINQHDKMKKGGMKASISRWGLDASEVNPSDNEDTLSPSRPVADISGKIVPKANIRCKNVSELKAWFEKFKQNAQLITLDGFKDTDEDWKSLFEYLDNNDWKRSHGKEVLVWTNFVSAVKWAWTDIKNKRQYMVASKPKQETATVESPGDEFRRNDDLRRRMNERFGNA